jgi:TPR repeat protein
MLEMRAERARLWRLRLASWRGDPAALYDLACACELGIGQKPDADAATRWHRRAAIRGDARSMAALGQRHATGQTLPLDRIEALAWLSLAVDLCAVDVLRRVFAWQRDDLAGSLNPIELERASARARELAGQIARRGAHRIRRRS